MDVFDYADSQQTPRRGISGTIWNILTILALIGVLCVGTGFLMIFINPQMGLNPFPPPTEIPTIALPTFTPTNLPILDPTWTPTPTGAPTATSTSRPTNTPLVSETPVIDTPAPTIPGGYSFVVQQGSPQAITNIYDPNAGCNWTGVGGQALDMTGAPVISLIVSLGGSLGGKNFDGVLGLTGTAKQLGPGGFVFTLADKPIASENALWIQLLDQQGLPLSDKVYFSTYNDCNKNLVVIQFKQVK
jgi:hypothetical protein